jgi:hypothetical protein
MRVATQRTSTLSGRRLAVRALAAVLVTLIGACSSSVVDLGGPDGLGTDYVQGAVYVLLNDRYLDTPQGPPSPPLVVVASPHSYPYGVAPGSLEEYRAGRSRWPKIRGILPAGTCVRLDRIEHHRYPGLDDWYEVRGILESGPFRGQEVNLGFISSGVEGSRMLRVNPDELAPESSKATGEPR